MLLPLVESTLPRASGALQKLNQWIFRGNAAVNCVALSRGPSRIRSAVAIGVHGLFPSPMLQAILGKPTGTSVKFAQMAAEAINRFALHESCPIEKVEQIALEGSGKIGERLDALWRLLLNWIELIRDADLVFIACHSQGVPVGVSLVARLVESGYCKKGVRVGICAMAGVSLGPFADLQSRWLAGSAGELFDLARPDSEASKSYLAALDNILQYGVKLTFVGSLNDQLVPLHSSTFSSLGHPHIFRAVWIDGRQHVPSFLTALLGFALKLRNLGIPDHGLLSELSRPLAGSLVGGEGHSVRIFSWTPPVLPCINVWSISAACLFESRVERADRVLLASEYTTTSMSMSKSNLQSDGKGIKYLSTVSGGLERVQ